MEDVDSFLNTSMVFVAERLLTFYLTVGLIFVGDGMRDLILPSSLVLVVIAFVCINSSYFLEATFHNRRSFRGQCVDEILGMRLNWYPAERYAFWIERLVMLQVTVCTFILYNSRSVDHRVLQIPSLLVFPASNLLYLLASYPNLLKLDNKEEETNVNEQGGKTEKEAEFVNKCESELAKCNEERKKLKEEDMQLIRELPRAKSRSESTNESDSEELHESDFEMPEEELRDFCSLLRKECMRLDNLFNESEEECKNLKEENMLLNLEVTATKARCDENYKLLIYMMSENIHVKCREEMNQLIAELNDANASSTSYRHLLHDI